MSALRSSCFALVVGLLAMSGVTAQTNLDAQPSDSLLRSNVFQKRGDVSRNSPIRSIRTPKQEQKVHTTVAAVPTAIPTWSGTFSYHGVLYPYSMVGTDPRSGSATTTVPVILIPLRFVFADGHTYDAGTDLVDGQQQTPSILNSPIFQNYDYVIGGTHVGNTQYGDAFQRANFWDSVSTGSPNYHVLLGTPTVAPVQTINVPNGSFGYQIDPQTSQVFPFVTFQFLEGSLLPILQNLNVNLQTLPIFNTGLVSEDVAWGYHSAVYDGSGRTIIIAPFLHHDAAYYGQHVPDLYVLSHEVVEWLDDPFDGYTPGWNFAGSGSTKCDSALTTFDSFEVGDPLAFYDPSIIPIQIGSQTFHLTDAVFIDFFTRSTPSRSVNGQYSLFASISAPTPPCIGVLRVYYQYFSYPGSVNTFARSINDPGAVVGFYQGSNHKNHGYLYQNSTFTALDFPGSIETSCHGINDAGAIVGSYKNSLGNSHGFLFSGGLWTSIDFPGAAATFVYGINNPGTMVGSYTTTAGRHIGFVRDNGVFDRVTTPKWSPNLQVFDINNSNSLAATASDNFTNGPFRAFDGNRRHLNRFAFPDAQQTLTYAINDSNETAGYFIDPDGYFAPYASHRAYLYFGSTTYFPYTYPFGYNNTGRITGDNGDPSIDGTRGFIGTLIFMDPSSRHP